MTDDTATRLAALERRIAVLEDKANIPRPLPQPTGTGIVRSQDLSGPHALKGKVSFPVGTYALGPDFNTPSNYPVYAEYLAAPAALLGSGIDFTVLSPPANCMSAATQAKVPAQPTVSNPLTGSPVNPLHLIRIDGGEIRDLTVLGTAQQKLYNGISLYKATGIKATRVKVKGIPGDSSANPGETFAINVFRCTGAVLTTVEVDGTDARGTQVGASGIGVNSSVDTTVTDLYSHDNRYGAGITFYDTTGTIVVRRLRSNRNALGLNFERCIADVLLDHIDVRGNTSTTRMIVVDSDKGSSKVRIVNPVFDGPKLVVQIHQTYWKVPNLQRPEDITVEVDGVPRPDLLAIVRG